MLYTPQHSLLCPYNNQPIWIWQHVQAAKAFVHVGEPVKWLHKMPQLDREWNPCGLQNKRTHLLAFKTERAPTTSNKWDLPLFISLSVHNSSTSVSKKMTYFNSLMLPKAFPHLRSYLSTEGTQRHPTLLLINISAKVSAHLYSRIFTTKRNLLSSQTCCWWSRCNAESSSYYFLWPLVQFHSSPTTLPNNTSALIRWLKQHLLLTFITNIYVACEWGDRWI